MTKEEAIHNLQDLWNEVYNEDSDGYTYAVAIDMAIEALSESSVVRCKDCKYIDCCTRTVGLTRHFDGFREYRSEIIDFCSYGERREP